MVMSCEKLFTPAAVSVRPVAVVVALLLMVKEVRLLIAVMTEPAGMNAPATVMPTVRPAVEEVETGWLPAGVPTLETEAEPPTVSVPVEIVVGALRVVGLIALPSARD